MNSYASLLQLNFMMALRTDSMVVNILIAMLVPLVSQFITRFFNETWPDFVLEKLCRKGGTSEYVYLPSNRNSLNNAAKDIALNDFLQPIVLQYIAAVIKPEYSKGKYQYKQLPSSYSTRKGEKRSLGGLLQACYSTFIVPADDTDVTILPEVTFEVSRDAKGMEEKERNWKAEENVDDEDDKVKKKPHNTKAPVVLFVNSKLSTRSEDPIFDLVKSALSHLAAERARKAEERRYLFQPLMQGLDHNAFPKCQRYTLSHEKNFGTLFFPEKEKLMKLIEAFENKTGKFATPGLSRKLILLLHGPPGTGKTSLVKAIADMAKRHVFSIPLSRIKTNRELISYMFDTSFVVQNEKDSSQSKDKVEKLQANTVVYVLEDVDATSEAARRKDKKVTPTDTPEHGTTPTASTKAQKEVEGGKPSAADAESVKGILHKASAADAEEKKEEGASATTTTPTPEQKVSVVEDDDSSGVDEGGENGPTVDRVTVLDKDACSDDQEDRLSTEGLLEAFGGILDTPGRIVILTTNHIEHLDPRLLRPGVTTMKLFMGNFDAKCAIEMVKHYLTNPKVTRSASSDLGSSSSSTDASLRDEKTLAEIAKIIESAKRNWGGFSPAEVEQLCAESETLEDLLFALKGGSRREVF